MTEIKNNIRGRRRQAILNAAAEEFCENGFEHARMDAIALRAGIGKSTIYEYFPSKSALLHAVGEQMVGRVTHEIGTILQSELPFRGKIISYMRFLNSMIAHMGQKLMILFREDSSLVLLDQLGQQYVDQLSHALATEVERAQKAGELRRDLEPSVVAALLSSIPPSIFKNHSLSVETLADLLIQGMGARV